MTQQDLPHWIAMSLTAGVGSHRVRQWLKEYDTLPSLFRHQPSLFLSPSDPRVEANCRWAEEPNHHILTLASPDYPAQLAEISSPPLVLFVIGDKTLLSQPQLAIVGSRVPSQQGIVNAGAFTQAIAEAGWVITSGMADGIDGVCHRMALGLGKPTIAVLGTGVDIAYPRLHTELAREIGAKGALISEFALGTPPRAEHFPRRNRIISGLSAGVLVVEATQKSGSLITARFAAEQGREVFAIPGSIHNPKARGCHILLKDGAALVETAEDITRELTQWKRPISSTFHPQIPPPRLDNDQQVLVNTLGDAVTSLDLLVARSGYSVASVMATMTRLELTGIVERTPGGYVRIYDKTTLA